MNNKLSSNLPAVVRNDNDDGWKVNAGIRAKEFLDAQSGFFPSRQNAYVQAVNYSEQVSHASKRKFSVERNCKIIDRINKLGLPEKIVRITRPLGGYKTFKVEASIKEPFLQFTPTDIQRAIQMACNWFAQEREKCQENITSKNTEAKKERKTKRHSFLFGDPGFLLKAKKPGKRGI